MIDFEREQLDRNPDWRYVLEAYHDRLASAREREPEHDGWLARLDWLDGVEDDRLPRIHGKLIAFGFLKFQVTGRNGGVVYQLSPLGKRILGQTDAEDDSESEAA